MCFFEFKIVAYFSCFMYTEYGKTEKYVGAVLLFSSDQTSNFLTRNMFSEKQITKVFNTNSTLNGSIKKQRIETASNIYWLYH